MPDAASDVYLGCQCDVFAWGGALSSALGLAHALAEADLSPLLLGASSKASTPAGSARGVRRMNLTIPSTGSAWRVANWVRAGRIARALHVLPAPRTAFVANSPFWALAARRVWPRVCLIYRFPCMLSHCLPFTWPPNRPRTAWERVDFAGLRRAERVALERSDVIWAATQANVDEICEFAPRAASKVQRIRFGHRALKLDPQRREFIRSEHGFREATRVLLTGGVLDRNKACEHAIDALAELPDSYALLVVGDGNRREALQQHASRRGVAERTRFVGVQRDIAPFLAAADVVLSTSYYDAFPNLIREAIVAGVPVVLPRNDPPRVFSGLADFLEHRGAALTYAHGDSSALASAIARFADAAVTEQCVRAGQAVAQREFRWDDCVRAILAARG